MAIEYCEMCAKNTTRDGWGPGPWDGEPNHLLFEHAGLPCMLHRGPAGSWCGYVAVPPGHPAHGKDCDDVEAEAHGGLTYAGACSGHICHVPKPGEPDDVWWLGFDCAHAWDLSPALRAVTSRIYPQGIPLHSDEVYRDMSYVREKVEGLAVQLQKAGQN